MRKILLAASAALALAAGPAMATTVLDPTGDFLPSFAGPNDADLDVTSFSVIFNDVTDTFMLNAVLAGDVDPSRAGIYVIGVNTGTGVARPFASIGAPNVIFNQALVIQKTGMGSVSVAGVPTAFTATILDNTIAALIPLSFLPSTGFAADHYGFNIWPRTGLGNNNQISDFAPDNATLAAVPEPASWALMITGFGLAGALLRRRRLVHG